MQNRALEYGVARPRKAKSVLPEIVLFSMCILTLLIGFAG